MSEESGFLKQVARPNQAMHTEIEAPTQSSDFGMVASLCCHEVKKQNAVLMQRIDFLKEQLSEERIQAKEKERQFNQIVDAFKQASHVSSGPSTSQIVANELGQPQLVVKAASSEQVSELLDALEHAKLTHELATERLHLDYKHKFSQKHDEMGELQLRVKHLQSANLLLQQDIQRQRDDFQMSICSLIDKQVTRLSEEKAAELQQINRRNEMLIMQMCQAHQNEVKCLRDRISELERQIRSCNQGPSFDQQSSLYDSQIIKTKCSPANEKSQTISQYKTEVRLMEEAIQEMEGQIDELTASNNQLRQSNFSLQESCQKLQSEAQSKQSQITSAKQKESHLTSALERERKIADLAKKSVHDHQKCEKELYRRQSIINELKAELQKREYYQKHQYKILLHKRDQIEHEKLEFIKQQHKQQKLAGRSNSISELRLESKLKAKQTVIETEKMKNESLIDECIRMKKEVAQLRRSRVGMTNEISNQQDISFSSLYFSRGIESVALPSKIRNNKYNSVMGSPLQRSISPGNQFKSHSSLLMSQPTNLQTKLDTFNQEQNEGLAYRRKSRQPIQEAKQQTMLSTQGYAIESDDDIAPIQNLISSQQHFTLQMKEFPDEKYSFKAKIADDNIPLEHYQTHKPEKTLKDRIESKVSLRNGHTIYSDKIERTMPMQKGKQQKLSETKSTKAFQTQACKKQAPIINGLSKRPSMLYQAGQFARPTQGTKPKQSKLIRPKQSEQQNENVLNTYNLDSVRQSATSFYSNTSVNRINEADTSEIKQQLESLQKQLRQSQQHQVKQESSMKSDIENMKAQLRQISTGGARSPKIFDDQPCDQSGTMQ